MTIDAETAISAAAAETPLGPVLGTRDWRPEDFAAPARRESSML